LSERIELTPLAVAAATAFPRIDLAEADAGRLSHGMKIEPPPGSPAGTAESPAAAFAPDGSLIALVRTEAGRLRPLAVFA
jgi:tRNA pseudouridine55 synthase